MPRVIPIGISLTQRAGGSVGVSASMTASLRGVVGVSGNVCDRASGSILLTGDISSSDFMFSGKSTVIRKNDGAQI